MIPTFVKDLKVVLAILGMLSFVLGQVMSYSSLIPNSQKYLAIASTIVGAAMTIVSATIQYLQQPKN